MAIPQIIIGGLILAGIGGMYKHLTKNELKESKIKKRKSDMKRKVFISYHHANDQAYKDYLIDENNNYGWFIDKSISDGDIDPDNKTLTTKQLIKQQALDDTSVIIVLYGAETYKRKHVDWEIYGALTRRGGATPSGLIGVLLDSKDRDEVHERYLSNYDSEYAITVSWDDFIKSPKTYIEDAIYKRDNDTEKLDNSAIQMKNNKA